MATLIAALAPGQRKNEYESHKHSNQDFHGDSRYPAITQQLILTDGTLYQSCKQRAKDQKTKHRKL